VCAVARTRSTQRSTSKLWLMEIGPGHRTTRLIVVELNEDDIPGASLSEPFESHTIPALKWWLLCQGINVCYTHDSTLMYSKSSIPLLLLPFFWWKTMHIHAGVFVFKFPQTIQWSPGISLIASNSSTFTHTLFLPLRSCTKIRFSLYNFTTALFTYVRKSSTIRFSWSLIRVIKNSSIN